jgi:hypothetical protein
MALDISHRISSSIDTPYHQPSATYNFYLPPENHHYFPSPPVMYKHQDSFTLSQPSTPNYESREDDGSTHMREVYSTSYHPYYMGTAPRSYRSSPYSRRGRSLTPQVVLWEESTPPSRRRIAVAVSSHT